ncbi:MAG: DUF4301 family protein [Ichthyobacteriaceae bacterium]|nr:DUF4301 family protein [Ichthyobacteriaceae bacterium]
MLKEKDLKLIDLKGISKTEIEEQINNFKNGFPFAQLDRPAVKGDGILVVDGEEEDYFYDLYTNSKNDLNITKFVPASGAASRMFKDLFTFFGKFDAKNDDFAKFIEENKLKSVKEFFCKVENFAFYKELIQVIKDAGVNFDEQNENEKKVTLLDYLLTEKGLNYGNKPKGILAFHFYYTKYRTAVAEHLVEGARYATGANRKVNIHFTISEDHRQWFEELVESKIAKYQKVFNVVYNVEYSYQLESTDTIAVDMNNEPFEEDGDILFRPGGHGALINNLDTIDADMIFIKNIDNVVPDHIKDVTVKSKRVLGGVLLAATEVINNYQNRFASGDYTELTIESVDKFFKNKLSIKLPESFYSLSLKEKATYMQSVLDRPVRVCGMVKNEGEPGGGPFWIKDTKGMETLQIVESAQIDMADADQVAKLKQSTHFNPVDIVCNTKNWMGKSFDLSKFIDKNTGFISEKSKNGRDLKALERPGLWNGAMADWNTIFVQVPSLTFNPVKTVNDLLRAEHQSSKVATA